ncbi:MAG: CdaR family protein, partial [Oscillospiraceae bacterium]
YKNAGLDILEAPDIKVDLEIRGPAKDIGRLTAKDFVVYPNVNSVVSPGIKTLNLVYTTAKPNVSYQIVSCSEESVAVPFEKIVKQKFTVEPDLSQISVKQGYILNPGTTTPAEIYISGPETRISKISKVKAQIKEGYEELTESKLTSGSIVLYNADGVIIDPAPFTMDTDTVEVNISVLKKAELPVHVEFTNVPQGMDTSILEYTLSYPTLKVAVPTSKSDIIESLCIGYVDLQAIDLSEELTFDVELPEGYSNTENINQITLNFKSEKFETKSVTVSDVRIINKPKNYDVTVETSKIYNVILVGTPSQLANIDTEDVVAQVDAANLSMQKGEQNIPAQILVPSSNNVFATGKYMVLVKVVAQ